MERHERSQTPQSVLEAIKLGIWDFEPRGASDGAQLRTRAMPGTPEKVAVLAERVARGEPLWNPADCLDLDELDEF